MSTKVFVGNLSFSMKEADLAQEFEKFGKVSSANIITRGPRSLGYGFVEFTSQQDAVSAVKQMDKKEIGDPARPVNVELAKPRAEGAEKPESKEGKPLRKRSASTGKGVPRRRNSRGEGRPRRRRPANEDRVPSKTTLFVANLAFSVSDEAFAKVFREAGVAPKSAVVARYRNGDSKGFGFVEFENEADQKKALNTLNSKELEGRPLEVKIALSVVPQAEKKPETPQTEKRATPEKKEEKEEKKPEAKIQPKEEKKQPEKKEAETPTKEAPKKESETKEAAEKKRPEKKQPEKKAETSKKDEKKK